MNKNSEKFKSGALKERQGLWIALKLYEEKFV
jgi:hypothetical protein